MPQTLRVLCVHGVGSQEVDTSWQAEWQGLIADGLRAWNPELDIEAEFLAYDARFTEAKYDIGDAVLGTAGLGASAVVHTIGDAIGSLFGRRGISGPGEPAARGKLDDSLRWTIGMVQQWAADRKLRESLRKDLLKQVNDFKPNVIAAHSLGSLIAYDTFARNQGELAGRVLVTFGSQIANPGVRSTFGGRIVPLEKAAHWYHLYNECDRVLTAPIKLSAPNFTQVETLFDIPGDVMNHSAEWYLSRPATSECVWRPVAGSVRAARGVRGMGASLSNFRSVTRVSRPKVKHRAVLVGINDYPAPEDRLEGCVNDCFRMSEVLQELGFDAENIRLVLNDRATSSAVLERLDWLLEDSDEGDLRIFYYSGHGARIPDYGPDETVDHRDECLCTYDFDWKPEHCITDDRFFELYSQLPYGTNFVSILDCCHSGGMTRDGGPRIRGLSPPDDIRHRAMKWDAKRQMWVERSLELSKRALTSSDADEKRYMGERGDTKKLGSAVALWNEPREFERQKKELKHFGPFTPVLIQACRENEYSYEYRHGVTSYGAFTYAASMILRELRAAKRNPSVNDLVKLTATRLSELGYRQSPQVVGPKVKVSAPLLPQRVKRR